MRELICFLAWRDMHVSMSQNVLFFHEGTIQYITGHYCLLISFCFEICNNNLRRLFEVLCFVVCKFCWFTCDKSWQYNLSLSANVQVMLVTNMHYSLSPTDGADWDGNFSCWQVQVTMFMSKILLKIWSTFFLLNCTISGGGGGGGGEGRRDVNHNNRCVVIAN